MSDIKGPPADMTFTMSITRKETGITETYQMEGFIESETPIEEKEPEPCPQQ